MAIVKNLASVMTTANITSSATSIPVNRTNVFGASQNPLDNPFYVTIMPASGSEPANTTNSEIALVTGISGSNLIVTRGQRSTTARAFSSGAIVTMGIYAEDAVLLGDGGTTVSTTVYRKKLVDKDGNTIVPIMGNIGPVYTASLSSASGGIATYTFTPDTPVEANRVYAVKFPTPTVNNAVILLGDGSITASSILLPPVAASDSPSYELAYTYNINDTEVWLLMYNGSNQWVCLNQKRKVATADLEDDAVGWKYLGQAKLTAVSNLVQFFFPKRYNFYKIIFAGEMASGSNTWVDLRLLTGTSGNVGNLTGDHQTWEVVGTTWGCLAATNVIYQLNTGDCYQYDTINLEFSSFKTASTQWRKFQGNIYKVGGGFVVRSSNGRLNSSTEPTGLEVITGGTFGTGATMKVWGSNI